MPTEFLAKARGGPAVGSGRSVFQGVQGIGKRGVVGGGEGVSGLGFHAAGVEGKFVT